jgi:hypothetical protein
MFSFVVVLFFSITGLTLNHAEYFQSSVKTSEQKGSLDSFWVNAPDTLKIQKLQVVEFFRNKYGVKGAVADFRIDESEISVSFKGPGYEADVFIERATGAYELTQTKAGLIGFLNDLHKGRDTGKTWFWIIDIAAILMVIISLTGLILLLYIKKKRWPGIVLGIIGFLILYVLYHFWGQ